ncbi:putative glucan endo-1,3-beta-glucosidase btgC [Psilocybe cubensis]|uniref:Glucan endo-1,3-beta-glucosidase btgC n=2 Tax=Psilocybe cubensis TaxID=181762 RepID=A0ACB8H573_PSICU|nr:putative glucan endo-1,3-beta-glucosidase btgC [Psilocybe cubensis]KAH9482792.1 putative glucan endo-1,3-beta-glucosidase btgC [Psilocybe cubensis]
MSDTNYQSLEKTGAFERPEKRSKRSKIIIIASVVGFLVLVAAGIAVGVIVSNNNKEKSTGTTNSGTGTKSGTNANSADPSVFKKDSRLHRSLYGLAYTPEGSLPDYGCSSTLEQVILDVQLMSQLTPRIRLYGADCNQTALVLEAIRQTKVDLQVYLGNYVVDGDPGAYERQRDVLKQALMTYGSDNIAGLTVGNEFMLNYVTAHKIEDVNSPEADIGAQVLIDNIADTRAMLASLNLPKAIPVGNSDAGSYFSTKVLEKVEYGLSNVHAWFANTTIEEATPWVRNFFLETNIQPASLLPNRPTMFLAETGWPTGSKDAGNANNGFADASTANLQKFLDDFVCQANADGLPYFFFEYFDEEWKDAKYGGVEGYWGLFNKDRTLKDVKIPTCLSP